MGKGKKKKAIPKKVEQIIKNFLKRQEKAKARRKKQQKYFNDKNTNS